VLAVVSLLALAGCGTVMNGGSQTLEIRSPTPGAEVTVKSFKGRDTYQGPPGRVKLAREDSYTVTVSAPGHRERKVQIAKSMSGWMFGNLILIVPILWGVGVAVDASSGGLWTLGDDLDVPLLPVATPPAPAQPAPAGVPPALGVAPQAEPSAPPPPAPEAGQ
jgi:hypothetical protein